MATDKLVPNFFRVLYDTGLALHVETRTIREVTSSGAGDAGTVVNWADVEVATDAMIEDYIDAKALYQPDSVEFISYQLFRKVDAEADPELLFEKAYPVTGALDTLTGRKAAVQHMLVYRTDNFGLMKIVSLDRESGNTFGLVESVAATPEATFNTYITGTSHALTGHDNGRPYGFKNLVITLNDRLMRSYGRTAE